MLEELCPLVPAAGTLAIGEEPLVVADISFTVADVAGGSDQPPTGVPCLGEIELRARPAIDRNTESTQVLGDPFQDCDHLVVHRNG